MTMAMDGLAKLAEELGELQAVVGKMLAYGHGPHPDGKGDLLTRLEEEAADVTAALTLVSQLHGMDHEKVKNRAAMKLAQFQAWHSDPFA